MGILDRILRAGEGKKLKALEGLVPDINAISRHECAQRRRSARQDQGVPWADRARREPRRSAHRSIRRHPRGRHPGHRPAPLRRPADGRRSAALRLGRRDEDGRGQDTVSAPCPRTSTASVARACTSSPSTTTSPASTPSGWAVSTSGWVSTSASSSPASKSARPRSEPTTPATSRTAPTTSSVSTTYATTWPRRSPTRCSAATTSRSSTRSTPS